MIRKAEIKDLSKLAEIAGIFSKISKFVSVDMEIFCKSWAGFIENELGVIFVSEKDNEITGCIGGLKFNDPNSGVLMASELFWIVHPNHRGIGLGLLKAFEGWAKDNDCKKVVMVHISDCMPEVVKKIYERKGYEKMETHYIKGV